ncbi:MAG: LON peptidase substrate-binding domain-containing protein [Acidobacteriaceae bacterium]|nr:LON peptidase substrate-binding domain-containing protein [Acidobacteriaceae bacterium]
MATHELIPLFPLSLVLLPAMPLPLHIFEERYKEMIGDLLSTQGEFGVVLAKDNGIVNIGCTARVERVVKRYPDGRLDLVAIGQRRFIIDSLDEEKSYLRAQVEFFNDEDATEVPFDLRQRTRQAYRTLLALEEPGEVAEPNFDLNRMSFQVAQFISDVDKRQTVLSLRSEIARLEFLVNVIPEYVAQQERIARANRVAPLNGHVKAQIGQ